MPEGLNASLDHQQMADLLAYLNASDESLKIRQRENGEVALSASRGIVSGSSAYYNPDNSAIEWIGAGDSIEWTVYDLSPASTMFSPTQVWEWSTREDRLNCSSTIPSQLGPWFTP